MRFVWQLIFWGISILAWIVLPVAQDYEASGYFTHEEKLQDSCDRQIRFYKIVGAPLVVLFIVYLYYFNPSMYVYVKKIRIEHSV